VREGGFNFRQFLPESMKLTELVAPPPKSEEDLSTPSRQFAQPIAPAPRGTPPTHEHHPKSPTPSAQKISKAQKGADPIGTFRRGARRAPNYVWLSEKSRETRASWANQLSRPF
jgi:hypothetical protein